MFIKLLQRFASIIVLSCISFQVQAQGNISINQPRQLRSLKSVSQARSTAFANTLMPLAAGVAAEAIFKNNTLRSAGAFFAAYGILMGPSTGNFYAEDYSRGMAGLGLRAIGAYLMVDATSEIFGRSFANALYVDDHHVSLTDARILVGAGLIVGGFLYNIISAKRSVKEFNKSISRFSLLLTPSRSRFQNPSPMLTARINL